jgi:hypothetical protein
MLSFSLSLFPISLLVEFALLLLLLLLLLVLVLLLLLSVLLPLENSGMSSVPLPLYKKELYLDNKSSKSEASSIMAESSNSKKLSSIAIPNILKKKVKMREEEEVYM